MGVSPHINWLYSDLADGLAIFQLFDIIRPGIVSWPKVHKRFTPLRKFMEKLENCNYAVDLGKQLKFSLVGIAGQDLSEGNATLTLGECVVCSDSHRIIKIYKQIHVINAQYHPSKSSAALIWQLMRAYTLSVLSQLANTGNPIIEKEIVAWANRKLDAASKTSTMRSFQDSAIADGRVVLDLIDAIKPGSVNYELVKLSNTEEVSTGNGFALELAI